VVGDQQRAGFDRCAANLQFDPEALQKTLRPALTQARMVAAAGEGIQAGDRQGAFGQMQPEPQQAPGTGTAARLVARRLGRQDLSAARGIGGIGRGGGEGRRRYLDFIASQIFPGYRQALKSYDKALRSRNYLLKRDASPRWPEIDAYSRLLHDYGQVLSSSRRVLIERLKPKAAEAQIRISGSAEALALSYESASGEGDDLLSLLRERRDEEVRRRQTAAGPHRDDLILELNGMPAAKFASEGQQRTVALALKLGQTNLFLEDRNEAPLMLIDDVFGELDPERRNALMANWPATSQKLITTTHLDWLDNRFEDAARLKVAGAVVS